MPSTLFDALNGSVAPVAQPVGNPALDQDFIAQLTRFRDMMAPMMQGVNPQSMFMSFMARQGYTPAQTQQLINQYSAQATEIQRQLMGG